MSDSSVDITDASQEKSSHLAAIAISDLELPEGSAPLDARKMRVRRLDVFPGGIIAVHDHANRPAILFVLRGEMTVNVESRDGKPVSEPGHVVRAGEAVAEYGNVTHWAQNNSDSEPLALLTFDLLDDAANPVPVSEAV